MITCRQLIKRVLDAVDGAEVDASPRDTSLAILRAGTSLAGIALSRLDEADRERGLRDLEQSTRDYMAAVAERLAQKRAFH